MDLINPTKIYCLNFLSSPSQGSGPSNERRKLEN